MKALIILSVLLIAITLNTEAKVKEKDSDGIRPDRLELNLQTHKKMCNHIFYPAMAKDMQIEGTVRVSLSVDAAGKITIKAINGHPVLMESVRNQLNKICTNQENRNCEKIVAFRFEIM